MAANTEKFVKEPNLTKVSLAQDPNITRDSTSVNFSFDDGKGLVALHTYRGMTRGRLIKEFEQAINLLSRL